MHDAHLFLKALAIVLCVAAVTTVVFHRLKQPVVLGYIIAGLIIGPHVPVPLVADTAIVQTLSELGVILLMFSLGLEFSLARLLSVGVTATLTAVVQCSIMMWLGFMFGRTFGWTTHESLFLGAIIAISSTTIIAKAFDEQKVRGRRREIVVGVLVVEDLIAILLMAVLTAVSTGHGLSADALALTMGRLGLFLVALIAVGLVVVPRVMRMIVRQNKPEMTLVASMGICFAIALLAQELGYSVALGAFIAGSLVAESREQGRIEHLVRPVRDIFAAIFFVSVGMLIVPEHVAEHWLAICLLTVVVIVGKIVSVFLGAFLSGNSIQVSTQAGMSLAQIGEFSFIIAGLGLTLGATGEFLYPVAVAVSAVTTLTTPWLIRASEPTGAFIDRKLPRPLQTFASLYGSWVEQIRRAPQRAAEVSENRRMFRLLALDAALLSAIVIGAALGGERVARALEARLGVDAAVAPWLVFGAAALLSVPFGLGIFRLARRLGASWATLALPESHEGKLDLAAAPRRALVVTLQLAIVVCVGTPIVAITQPFLPGLQSAAVLLAFFVVLGVAFWRSTTNLQGHVRAGAEMILEVMGTSQHDGDPDHDDSGLLARARELLPGLGTIVSVRIAATSPAVGKTLAELNLRGQTGATVLAIARDEEGVIVPTGQEQLSRGDVLAITGTEGAVAAAQRVFGAGA